MLHRSFLALGFAAALALAFASKPAHGDPDKVDDHTLTAKELARYFSPYVPDVRRCYSDHARSKDARGTLRLELVIHSNGSVVRFEFSAPGVVEPALGHLDACLRPLSATWHFPVRKGFTSAVLPFVFLVTPGATKGQP